jgi:hypothetical protein
MKDYFEKVDLILQNKIKKMPLERNTIKKLQVYLTTYKDCLIEMEGEMKTLFYDFTDKIKLSEKEIAELNDYNYKAISSFVDKFKV